MSAIVDPATDVRELSDLSNEGTSMLSLRRQRTWTSILVLQCPVSSIDELTRVPSRPKPPSSGSYAAAFFQSFTGQTG
jgi:hypothetical protein